MRVVKIICSFLFLFFLNSCVNNHKSTPLLLRNSASQELVLTNLIGAYYGDLPCAGCDAIATILSLERDHSFKMTYTYQGKSDNQFVKEGKWSIHDDQLALEGVDYMYKIEPTHLVQLDLSGEEIKGELANKYQLNKIK